MTSIQNLSCNVKQNVSRHLYHIMLYRVHFTWSGFELTMLVLIGTDYKVIINPTTIRTQPRRLQNKFTKHFCWIFFLGLLISLSIWTMHVYPY